MKLLLFREFIVVSRLPAVKEKPVLWMEFLS
jgi:hypothetical protein